MTKHIHYFSGAIAIGKRELAINILNGEEFSILEVTANSQLCKLVMETALKNNYTIVEMCKGLGVGVSKFNSIYLRGDNQFTREEIYRIIIGTIE